MRKISFVFACLGTVLELAAATPARAFNNHSFVSATGSGTTCTFTVPCSDITTALGATSTDGIITCVDQGANSGGGSNITSITVTKSITIDCAGTAAASWFVNVNGAGIVVTLRNLQINSVGFPTSPGINFQNGAALFVEHCVIENWNGSGSTAIGINFAPSSGTAKLHVTDSVIKNNGNGSSGGGIIIQPSGSGSAQVVVERTQVENNTYGIFANSTGTTGTILLHIKDSTAANSTVNGISAYTAGSTAAIVIDHSSSLLNGGTGILSQGAGGYVFLTDTTVMSNFTGLSAASGGAIYSYGNNRLTGNVSDGAAPTTGGFALK